MPRYLVERLFSQISEDELREASTRSKRMAAEHFPGLIVWEHSHVVSDEDGNVITFCIYGAPDEETIQRHGELFGSHTIGRIYEIADDVTPADFPD